jgi:hypothetical protein
LALSLYGDFHNTSLHSHSSSDTTIQQAAIRASSARRLINCGPSRPAVVGHSSFKYALPIVNFSGHAR